MNVDETYEVIGLMDSLNPYAKNKTDAEQNSQADTWAIVLAEVPKAFALDYIGQAARGGRTVREITEITAAWRQAVGERMQHAQEALVAPDAIADDADAWLTWTRTARQAYAVTGSVEQAQDRANAEVGYTPELEPPRSVPREESIARLRALVRTQRGERTRGGGKK